jgi:[acyl-carrier-protein] S-malonyltransferase
VRQVANPVRWDLCQATLAERGVTGLLELAPGGVLTGLARRTLPGVEAFAVKSADDVDAARAFVARHAGAGTSSDA